MRGIKFFRSFLGALALAGFIWPGLLAGQAAEVRVFAAASLNEAFSELARLLQQRVSLNFAGSQLLASQLILGARADVFAAADERAVERLIKAGLVDGASVAPFAANRLALVVPWNNPGKVTGLRELARPGIKVVMGHPQVPVGGYTLQLLDNLARQPELGPAFKGAVLKNVVSQEQDVKFVLSKVSLGEADAGFVYVSDLGTEMGKKLRAIPLPETANPRARLLVAPVKGGNSSGARAFIELLLSEQGQAIMQKHGFLRGAMK